MKGAEVFLLVLVPLLVVVERSECVQCFASFDLTTGECSAELGEVELDDCCQNSQYGYQEEDGSCHSCGVPTWSPWSQWSFCNVLCGEGVKQRRRKCHGLGEPECENSKDTLQTDVCNGTCCNDLGWSSWNPWTPCSVTCEGKGTRMRQRVCSSPPECQSSCVGPAEETQPCEASNKCPVHGGWSSWTAWSGCSGSCIDSNTNVPSRVRQRTCSNPAPSPDTVPHGDPCSGEASERQDCSELPNCPVDGNWGPWLQPGPCSVTCGEGLQLESRRCENPSPKYGGKMCEGASTRSTVCKSPCPVDGFWAGWSNWGECSSTCISPSRDTFRTRHRSCSNPAPSINPPGKRCEGDDSEKTNCNLPHCSVNGNWGPWSAFSQCPVTCGVGLQVSERRCDSPAPNHGGLPCPGESKKNKLCYTQVHCPVNGEWSEWSAWSDCTYAWGGRDIRCLHTGGKQTRNRTCLHQAHNGAICAEGKLTETQVCYNVDKCYLKGSWEGWGPWSFCIPPCGSRSSRRRFRICKPDYSEYSPYIGRQKAPANFHGKPKADCPLIDGEKKYEIENCLNVPPCS
ncbi:properdin-like [Cyprinodon tularosa]|uniref:properdin-like n=1 Tax=Cyprinodon tularosa TaxID=77115 RepID=UPI0018E1EBCF|nr:properdin-like [Cyprinodon tularosa]